MGANTGNLGNFIAENDIYLFGPTGSGKTTLVENIANVAAPNYISIGAITREALANGDEEMTSLIARGGKIPLTAVQRLVSPRINVAESYILDGVPRHQDEAVWIHGHMLGRPLGAIALVLQVEEADIRRRIAYRELTSDRKDAADRVAARVQTYNANCGAVLDTLSPALDAIITVETSERTPQDVFNSFLGQIALHSN